MGALHLTVVCGPAGVKQVRVRIGDLEPGVDVASGLTNAGRLLDEIRADQYTLHFVEVTTCSGGCTRHTIVR